MVEPDWASVLPKEEKKEEKYWNGGYCRYDIQKGIYFSPQMLDVEREETKPQSDNKYIYIDKK